MSHQPERKEKKCLNCGTPLIGRFCHICGQENIITKQNFWSLTKHFLSDFFHFDGKFFHTLKQLLFQPGTVSIEYMQGKRMKYLDPIRMYLFTSAVFFLLFYSMGLQTTFSKGDKFLSRADKYSLLAQRSTDSSAIHSHEFSILLDTNKNLRLTNSALKPGDVNKIEWLGKAYVVSEGNLIQTDTLEQSWFMGIISQGVQSKLKRSKGDVTRMLEDIGNEFVHKMPYFLFISLPVFALILQLLYAHRKGFFFSDHAVFTIHHYILSFLLMLSLIIVITLNNKVEWGIFNWIIALIFILWPVHLYLAMKRFYRQGWLKTFVKFTMLNMFGITTLIFLFVVYTVFIIIV